MRKKVLIMMTALAMTVAAVPGTAMVTYAETMDGADDTEAVEDIKTEDAKKKAEEEKKKAEEEAQRQAEEEAKREAEEEAQRQAEEEAKREAEEEAQRQAEEEARREAEEEAQRQAEEEARREAEEEAQRQNEQDENVNYDITYTWEEKTDEGSIYTCTATAVAQDGTVLTETVEAVLEEIPASCENAGRDTYTAVFENPVFETQVKTVEIPANGHLFIGEPTYIWNDADHTCTAARTCETDGYTETETVTASAEIIQEATCTEAGYIRYIAEFTNPAFSAQLDKEEIPATGHYFAEPTYTWNDADNTCTATRVCEKDGYTETETVAASSEVILAPTSTETGIRRYIAEFTNPAFSAQLKKEEIAATGKKADNTKRENNTKKDTSKKENVKKKESAKKNENTTVVKKTTTQNQNTTASKTTKTAPVKTGDNTQPIIPIVTGTGALAAIAAVIMKLRSNRR